MKKFFEIPVLFMVTLAFTASMAIAKDYVIYSISQDIPMGVKDEKLKKNLTNKIIIFFYLFSKTIKKLLKELFYVFY